MIPLYFPDGTKTSCLMYADDLIILSRSAPGHQKCLNCLSSYCQKWKLSINMVLYPQHSVTLVKGARRAIFALNNKFSLKRLPVKIALKLFDSYISSILLYGLEIWIPFYQTVFNKWDSTKIEFEHLK